MSRDAAIITTWGNTVVGRERKSLEVFQDFLTFWGKKAADGKCEEPEAYFSLDGGTGMAVVKGKLDALMEIWDTEENEILLAKAHLVVQNLRSEFHITGEDIGTGVQRYLQAIDELGV